MESASTVTASATSNGVVPLQQEKQYTTPRWRPITPRIRANTVPLTANPRTYQQHDARAVSSSEPGAFDNIAHLDPVALKLDAAMKQSIASRTGDQALLREARIEQSIADRLGARGALLNSEPTSTPSSQAPALDPAVLKADAANKRRIADRTGNGQLFEESRIEQSIADRLGARGALLQRQGNPVGSQLLVIPKLNFSTQTVIPEVQNIPCLLSSDPAALKLDAAIKQSIADRTGDQSLKQQARIEQSLADRKGGRQALLDGSKQISPRGVQVTQTSPRGHVPHISPRGQALQISPRGSKEPIFNDPVALKIDSAYKQSIADRTGDLSLKQRASEEQSLADKSGARQALIQLQHGNGTEGQFAKPQEVAIEQLVEDLFFAPGTAVLNNEVKGVAEHDNADTSSAGETSSLSMVPPDEAQLKDYAVTEQQNQGIVQAQKSAQ